MYDFSADKSTPLSSSRIIRLSQLKQQPRRSFLLATKNIDGFSRNLDHKIQIQVSDFEDWVIIFNRQGKQ
jgi:hypothetical protein